MSSGIGRGGRRGSILLPSTGIRQARRPPHDFHGPISNILASAATPMVAGVDVHAHLLMISAFIRVSELTCSEPGASDSRGHQPDDGLVFTLQANGGGLVSSRMMASGYRGGRSWAPEG